MSCALRCVSSTAASSSARHLIGWRGPGVEFRAQRRMAAAAAQPARGELTQVERAINVVSKQFELYNTRQLDPFMDLMADDVHVSDGETGTVIATSKEQLRPRYVERFSKSPVHAELLGRLCLGSTIIDREIITGLPDGGEADCMATYVVNSQDKIAKITFVWRPRTQGTKM